MVNLLFLFKSLSVCIMVICQHVVGWCWSPCHINYKSHTFIRRPHLPHYWKFEWYSFTKFYQHILCHVLCFPYISAENEQNTFLLGTLGYVMSEVESGRPFSQVVNSAKSLGYTEPGKQLKPFYVILHSMIILACFLCE